MTTTDPTTAPCPNCGDPTPGRYCRTCGQQKTDRLVSLRRMAADFVEDQFSIGGTLPRTVGTLLFRPGRMTRDYLDGRIARYVPPLRLYLVTSLAFFLCLSFVGRMDPAALIDISDEARQELGVEMARERDAPAAVTPGDTVAVRDTAPSGRPAASGMAALGRRIEQRARERFADGPEAGAAWLLSGITERAPTAMFLLLPAFAGMLKLAYLRQRRLYIEHVVFALHTHAFAFVVFTVALLFLRGNETVTPVLFTGMLVYVLVAMRRVYGQGWPITLVKFTFLSASYSALLAVTLTGVVLAALLL